MARRTEQRLRIKLTVMTRGDVVEFQEISPTCYQCDGYSATVTAIPGASFPIHSGAARQSVPEAGKPLPNHHSLRTLPHRTGFKHHRLANGPRFHAHHLPFVTRHKVGA